ncbi:MAG: acryloyl-CoA reductase [Gammaproteobacteria bacterium]
MSTTFKALRVHRTAEGTVARFDKMSRDELSPGNVVIRVAYSCINYKDALAVTGKGAIVRGSPRTAGIDFSGVVESSGDPAYQPKQKVLVTGCQVGESLDGGFAEFARVPAEAVVPLPETLSLLEAMALGTAGFTAALALQRMLDNHQKPEYGPIAITGPTGGVGGIALALFKQAGFTTAAITGKKSSADYLRALGADEIIDRATLDLGSKPLEKAVWGGAVDNLGGDTLAYLTRTVRPWGNIACVGLAQSPLLNTTVIPLILRGVSLLGIHSVDMPRAWRLALWEKLAGEWRVKDLAQRIVRKVISLDDVPRACEELVAGQAVGRYVVRVADESSFQA